MEKRAVGNKSGHSGGTKASATDRPQWVWNGQQVGVPGTTAGPLWVQQGRMGNEFVFCCTWTGVHRWQQVSSQGWA